MRGRERRSGRGRNDFRGKGKRGGEKGRHWVCERVSED